MRLLRRVLARIDENLTDFDRPLAVVIPQPRAAGPAEPRRPFEVAGYWSHCSCCPRGCMDVHRDGCDLHQSDDVA